MMQASFEMDAAERAWVERSSEGSPGAAAVNVKFGVHAWASELAKPLAELTAGRFVGGLGDRMADLINECAEMVVKENSRASKEAANRLGTRLLFGVLGQYVRDGLAEAVERGDAVDAECWGDVADAIAESDEHIRRHLNLKQVLALLIARWSARWAAAHESALPAARR
jgi:hypothetical protein